MEYQSEKIGALAAALAKAQAGFTFAAKSAEAPIISKNKDGKTYQSGKRTYADLQSVLDAVREGLASNNIAVIQAPMPCQKDGILLRTTLAHESGEWIASELELPNDRMGGVQGMGSALTYARRYALAAMVGIAQDDDDGETAMAESKKAEKQRVQQVREQAAANNTDPPSREMFNALMATLNERGFKEQKQYLAEMTRFFGREIKSSKELTRAQVKEYLDACRRQDQENPF